METNFTEIQKFRMAVATSLNFDIKKAKEVLNFVIGNDGEQILSTLQPCSDGIYYVLNDGHLVSVGGADLIADQVVGVAVKMNDKIATVALHDAADGKEMALIDGKVCGTKGLFCPDFYDAITDWDGEDSTKDYGNALNPEIGLKVGQYIPSLAQLHLVLLNIKDVNKALKAVGGSPLKKRCYWSSTEYSAYTSWIVNFGSGYSGSYGSKYNAYAVRPAVALSV